MKRIPNVRFFAVCDADDELEWLVQIGPQAVAESLDQPYRIKWERSMHGDYDALAALDDGTYLSIMFNNQSKNNWMVEFYRNNRQEVTGEGDAQRVFATVLTAIAQFIEKKKPVSLFFSAVKEDDPKGSREKLYDRLVQRYAGSLGYTIHQGRTPMGSMAYKFTRKQQGVAEGTLTEHRNALYDFVKSKFPSWPEYVLRDFLYAQAKGMRDQQELKDFLERNQKDFGQVKWRLEKLPITLDIFTAKTQRMIKKREGGASNPYQVPKDAERHALQQRMIQQKSVSPEPIIVAKLSNGYDLIEGWHRTIQHLKAYPQGYTGPAWVGYGATYTSESKQGVAEGRISDLDQDLQDQQWEAVVGRVEHGVRRDEDPDRMSLALYQWATAEMFDMDEELERRGFGSVADLADHIRDHGGRYVPPKFDLGAAGSIKDIQRLPRRRPDDVAENSAHGRAGRVIDMLEQGNLEISRWLEENPRLLESQEGWSEIKSLFQRISGDQPRIGERYAVLNLIAVPPGKMLLQQGFTRPATLIKIRDRGAYRQYEFDVDGDRVRYPEDHRAGDQLSRTFLFQDPAAVAKTQTFVALTLSGWDIRNRLDENFADGKIKGKSRPGRVKRSGASCKGSVTDLRARAQKYGGERGKMYQWCLNMKSGRKKSS